jgi:hypothetical protein
MPEGHPKGAKRLAEALPVSCGCLLAVSKRARRDLLRRLRREPRQAAAEDRQAGAAHGCVSV